MIKCLLSKLLRELEAEVGTTDVASIVLVAFIDSVKSLKNRDVSEFCEQFTLLNKEIQNTEPKFGILNYYFNYLHRQIHKHFENHKIIERKWKHDIIKEVKDIIKEIRNEHRELIAFAEKIDVEGKTILLHDHAHTVFNVLNHYKALGRKFSVIIAEQSFEKTHVNIERMHQLQVPFQVVPAYMLSHMHDTIDMVFFGALTLKDTMDFVMVPGALGVISEFNMAKTPVYMFLNTDKFSLWKSKKRRDIFMHQHKRQHLYKPIEYERIKYSHDRVPVDSFKKIITNEGVFTPKQLAALYAKRFKEYNKSFTP